jgi:hypothetical protein
MKLLTVVLFSTLIWPSPFIPVKAKKPLYAHSAVEQVKVWQAKNHNEHVELLIKLG